MKILQINTVYNSGSTGQITAEIKHYVESKQDECVVAYGRGKSEEFHTYRISGKVDLYLHALLTRITDRTALYSSWNTQKLIKEIRKFGPDVIHLHNLHGYYLNYRILFWFFRQYKKPIVWTLHDCWAFTGHCVHFDSIKCNKWQNQCNKCPRKKEYPASVFIDASFKNYQVKRKYFTSLQNIVVITPSDRLKQKVQESFLKKYSIERIYNGIDLNQFTIRDTNLREQLKLTHKKVVLGVSNGWSASKGIDLFYNLALALSDSFQIIMIGLNEKQQKKCPSNIIAMGKTGSIDELVDYYNLADVYFNSSVEETMGLTTVEALACGTPVLVFNRTAIPEVVNTDVGRVIEDRNIEIIKRNIEDICNCKIEPSKCREQAMLFSKKTMCEQYYAVYHRFEKDS